MTDIKKKRLQSSYAPKTPSISQQSGMRAHDDQNTFGQTSPNSSHAHMTAADRNEILRHRIKALICTRKGDGYSTVSALLGRNASYMHQYITRGSPKCLREEDRRKIARHFGISGNHLFLTDTENTPLAEGTDINHNAIVMIDIWPTSNGQNALPFRRDWLISNFSAHRSLIAVTIDGDAMAPSLNSGSIALVDCNHKSAQRDGIYIMLAGGEAIPRRLSLNPLTGCVTIATDNHRYSGQTDCDPQSLSILGRVVWIGQCI